MTVTEDDGVPFDPTEEPDELDPDIDPPELDDLPPHPDALHDPIDPLELAAAALNYTWGPPLHDWTRLEAELAANDAATNAARDERDLAAARAWQPGIELPPIHVVRPPDPLGIYRTAPRYADIAAILAGDLETQQPTHLRLDDLETHLFYPAATNGIAGEPGIGKTTVACIALIQAMRDGHHVGYLDFEDRPERVIARLLALGAYPDELVERFHYLTDPYDPGRIAEFVADVVDLNLVIVVIDGIAQALGAAGLNEDVAADYAKWAASCPKPIALHGACVICCDHVTKNSDGRGLWPRGSGHKLALVDGAQYMLTSTAPFTRDHAGHITVTVAKDRAGHVGPRGAHVARIHLTPKGDGVLDIRITPPDGPREPGDTKPGAAITDDFLDDIVAAIDSLTGLKLPATRREIADRLRAENVAFRNDTLGGALTRLHVDGRAYLTIGPRNSKVYTTEAPCSTPDPDPATTNESPPPPTPSDTAESVTPPSSPNAATSSSTIGPTEP